jgi:hypothetical protein
MKPEIEAYLREHGATYTSDALRKALIAAGHDPADVDAAIREWEGARAGEATAAAAGTEDQRTFRNGALGVHVGALVAAFLIVIIQNGTDALGIAVIGAVVLAIFLAVGLAISYLIGRALLPRTGAMVALVVPVISAFALGGTCLAIMDGMIPTPATPGFVELQIEPPLSFEGSGAANCFVHQDAAGVSLFAESLGTLDGRVVSVSVDSYAPPDDQNAPAPAPEPGTDVSVYIALNSPSGSEMPIAYAPIFSSRLELDASDDRRSGTITFEGLAPEPTEGVDPVPSREPISGILTWACE